MVDVADVLVTSLRIRMEQALEAYLAARARYETAVDAGRLEALGWIDRDTLRTVLLGTVASGVVEGEPLAEGSVAEARASLPAAVTPRLRSVGGRAARGPENKCPICGVGISAQARGCRKHGVEVTRREREKEGGGE